MNEPIQLDDDQSYMLNSIIGAIQQRMMYLTESPYSTANQAKLSHYAYLHDVLEMHNCQNQPDMKELVLQGERPWQSELDIPMDEYVKALDDTIYELALLYTHPILRQTEARTEKYKKRVALIQWLKSHRKKQRSCLVCH